MPTANEFFLTLVNLHVNLVPRNIAETILSEKEAVMSDLEKYIDKRKKRDSKFAQGFEKGYEEFKIGVLLKQAREQAGLTQEQLAKLLKTQKTAISRIENHAHDIKLSTIQKVAKALGKNLEITLS